jgi:hypothetical protein
MVRILEGCVGNIGNIRKWQSFAGEPINGNVLLEPNDTVRRVFRRMFVLVVVPGGNYRNAVIP